MGSVKCKIAETAAERAGHFAVRQAVFVDEQSMFEDDRDEHDEHAIPIITVDTETGDIVGAVRVYEREPGVWIGGRLAVLPSYRRHAGLIGARLCRLAERTVIENGAHQFFAYIQEQNVRFFQRLKWTVIGEPIQHHGSTHQVMSASMTATAVPSDEKASTLAAP